MFIAALVTSILLALLAVGSGVSKFRKPDDIVANMAAVGVKREQMNILGGLEVAGALGLLAGLFWAPIGIAAAIGLVLYFVGAAIAHLKHKAPGTQIPAIIAVFAIATLVLRILSA